MNARPDPPAARLATLLGELGRRGVPPASFAAAADELRTLVVTDVEVTLARAVLRHLGARVPPDRAVDAAVDQILAGQPRNSL